MIRTASYPARLLLLIVIIAGAPGKAEVRLPAFYGSGMVLQRGEPVVIQGWASPGERVTVEFRGDIVTVPVASDSTWHAELPSYTAGGPYEMRIFGDSEHVLGDVMIGDVWFCSGQSNMEMYVMHANRGREEVADATYPGIRLFQVANEVAPSLRRDVSGEWTRCRPSTVGTFSATAYFFGRELHRETGVPVGLIHASWGGTPAEAWMPMDALVLRPDFRFILKRWERVYRHPSQQIIDYFNRMGAWHEDIYHIVHLGRPVPPRPDEPPSPVPLGWVPRVPSWCFNAMVAPFTPIPIRGVVWYQGESNTGRAHQYRTLFPALIGSWRRVWGDDALPFLFVQLANYGPPGDGTDGSAWAELREAQARACSLEHTFMAVTIDIGEAEDVHPRNKQEVGRRLALGALRDVYGRDVDAEGPRFGGWDVDSGTCRVRFTGTGVGLSTPPGEALTGFAVAGEDRVFHTASAVIDGNSVILWADEVPEPVAVRYGWADNPACNLYNSDGLPAAPFRTDDWPGITGGQY